LLVALVFPFFGFVPSKLRSRLSVRLRLSIPQFLDIALSIPRLFYAAAKIVFLLTLSIQLHIPTLQFFFFNVMNVPFSSLLVS